MRVNLFAEIKNVDGTGMLKEIGKPEILTLKDVIVATILGEPEGTHLSAAAKHKRYQMFRQAYEAKSGDITEISREDRKIIMDNVAALSEGSLITGQVVEMLKGE